MQTLVEEQTATGIFITPPNLENRLPTPPHSPHPTDSPWTRWALLFDGRPSARSAASWLRRPSSVSIALRNQQIRRVRVSGVSLLTPATSRRPGPFCHRPPTPPDRSRFIKARPPPLILLHTPPLFSFTNFRPSRWPRVHRARQATTSPQRRHTATPIGMFLYPPSRDFPRETRQPPTRCFRDPTASPFDLDELPEPGRQLSALSPIRPSDLGAGTEAANATSRGAQEP